MFVTPCLSCCVCRSDFVSGVLATSCLPREYRAYSVHVLRTQNHTNLGTCRATPGTVTRVCLTIYFYYLHKSESSHTHTDRHGLKRSGLEGRGMVWG